MLSCAFSLNGSFMRFSNSQNYGYLSLNSINGLFFLVKAQCVSGDIRTEF